MSLSKEIDNNPVEGSDSSDQSLSDSWTVLDSSHFKEDGDLSDAESVEVLREEQAADDILLEEEQAVSTSITSTLTASTTAALSTEHFDSAPIANGNSTEETVDTVSEGVDATATQEANDTTSAAPSKPPHKKTSRKKKFFFNDAPIEVVGDCFSTWLLELAVYSLFIDLILLCYFGMSSLAGLIDMPQFNYLKTTKPHRPYEMDPLSLQLSHVISEWKKHPQEDHSLDRHVLKTLLLYYGGSTELSANLHSLTEKVQKHNNLIKRVGKEQEFKDLQHHRMIISAHLAHSVACILGKQDNERALPAELFRNYSSDKNDEFSPEPGFWLNDWHLPMYFNVNDTYYRIDTKPILPPMRNLYLHLGSAKWNEYFWKLYRQDEEKGNEKEKVKEFEDAVVYEKASESELEREETERSPLDLTNSIDLSSTEESSGNVDDQPEESVEDFDPVLDDVDSEENKINHMGGKVEKFGIFPGGYFEVLKRDDHLNNDDGHLSRYEYTGTIKANSAENVQKGKLSQLFEQLALEEQQTDKPLRRFERFADYQKEENLGPLSDFDDISIEDVEMDISSELFKEEPQNEIYEKRFAEVTKKGSLVRQIFQELAEDESLLEEIYPRVMGKEKLKGNFFDDSQNENIFSEKFDNVLEPQKVKKLKTKGSKRKHRSDEDESEKFKSKGKQKRRDKERLRTENMETDTKRKTKKKGIKKEIKSGLSEMQGNLYSKFDHRIPLEQNYLNRKFGEERNSDWNTRMAEGREKLRALSEKGDDQIWVFERARARRDMREETFSE